MQIQEGQEEHDYPTRDDAVEGEGLVVPRVPRLPPEPSARQIIDHELTGHAVYRSWCRQCVASKGRAHAHASREEGELPDIGIDVREDVLSILCRMPKQFNRMLGGDSGCQERTVRLCEFVPRLISGDVARLGNV